MSARSISGLGRGLGRCGKMLGCCIGRVVGSLRRAKVKGVKTIGSSGVMSDVVTENGTVVGRGRGLKGEGLPWLGCTRENSSIIIYRKAYDSVSARNRLIKYGSALKGEERKEQWSSIFIRRSNSSRTALRRRSRGNDRRGRRASRSDGGASPARRPGCAGDGNGEEGDAPPTPRPMGDASRPGSGSDRRAACGRDGGRGGSGAAGDNVKADA